MGVVCNEEDNDIDMFTFFDDRKSSSAAVDTTNKIVEQ